jgi:hypothetical protein
MLVINHKSVKAQSWDTAGQERQALLPPPSSIPAYLVTQICFMALPKKIRDFMWFCFAVN